MAFGVPLPSSILSIAHLQWVSSFRSQIEYLSAISEAENFNGHKKDYTQLAQLLDHFEEAKKNK